MVDIGHDALAAFQRACGVVRRLPARKRSDDAEAALARHLLLSEEQRHDDTSVHTPEPTTPREVLAALKASRLHWYHEAESLRDEIHATAPELSVEEVDDWFNLDIGYSPVLSPPRCDYVSMTPRTAVLLENDRYRLLPALEDSCAYSPWEWERANLHYRRDLPAVAVSADEARVLRARYCLTRWWLWEHVHEHDYRRRRWAREVYFPNGYPWSAAQLDRLMVSVSRAMARAMVGTTGDT